MGSDSGKPVACEQGKHAVGMLQCQNSGCEEAICKKCWRDLGNLKVCVDCKQIMTVFQQGRDTNEIKRIGTMVERKQVSYEDKLAAETVLSQVENIPDKIKHLLEQVADAPVAGPGGNEAPESIR